MATRQHFRMNFKVTTILQTLLTADIECSYIGSANSKDTRRSIPGCIHSSIPQP